MALKNTTKHGPSRTHRDPQLGSFKPYLGPTGALALSFGCSIGWGAFLVPGTSFLPRSGLLGSLIGLIAGVAIMLVIARNYHTMIVQHPKAGGAFTVTRHMMNFDHGLLCAWFLCLTYLGLIWANCSAVALLARYTIGEYLPSHHLYAVAGFDIYLEEVLLCLCALLLAGLICLAPKKWAARAQIFFVAVLFSGLVISFLIALHLHPAGRTLKPLFLPSSPPWLQVLRAVTIMPWAFVGFESVSHAAEEFTFSPRLSFRIMRLSILMAALSYAFMLLTSVLMMPAQYPNWVAYIEDLDSLNGIFAIPTFSAAYQALGQQGIRLLGLTMLGGLFSSLVGNLLCLSRLVTIMAEKDILPLWLGKRTPEGIPQNAILGILGLSLFVPFLGRTAIGWNLDVSNIGATICYVYTSMNAYRYSQVTGDKKGRLFGGLGIAFSTFFLILQLIPSYTLAKESFLILTCWVILGLKLNFHVFQRDRSGSYGRSTIVWVVLVTISIFTSFSFVWQSSRTAVQETALRIESHYARQEEEEPDFVRDCEAGEVTKSASDPSRQVETELLEEMAEQTQKTAKEQAKKAEGKREDEDNDEHAFLTSQLEVYHHSQMRNYLICLALILIAIKTLLSSYQEMNRRELENERMLGEVKEKAFLDKLTGAQSINAYRDRELDINGQIRAGRVDPFALVICDVNDLKRVNDQLGHQAGDEHLRAAFSLLKSVFGQNPLYRIGGDEFVVLLEGGGYDSRQELMDRLEGANQENQKNGGVQVATGLSEWQGRGELMNAVFARADICMYKKKSEMKRQREKAG